MESKNYFSAFIMTYKRNSTLLETIKLLFDQTLPPEKILIVDNDPNQGAKIVLDSFPNQNIEYYSVGYNSGPAGASAIGLSLLAKQGYKWIAWIDDDDPPQYKDVFQILLETGNTSPDCGCVGMVGQYFDRKKGIIVRVNDAEIKGKGALEVDIIAGGMMKIINSKVVIEKNILPDPSLFFSFEDLDFDLNLQNNGYKLLVNKELYYNARLKHNNIGIKKQRGLKKDINVLWREYYSLRNLFIIQTKNKLYRANFFTFFRMLYKIISGFKYGLSYGLKNSKHLSLAFFHFIINKRGLIDNLRRV